LRDLDLNQIIVDYGKSEDNHSGILIALLIGILFMIALLILI
jgi:hypothetical protein